MSRYGDVTRGEFDQMIVRLLEANPGVDIWGNIFEMSDGSQEVHIYVKVGGISTTVFANIPANDLEGNDPSDVRQKLDPSLTKIGRQAQVTIDAAWHASKM